MPRIKKNTNEHNKETKVNIKETKKTSKDQQIKLKNYRERETSEQ